MNEQTTVYMAAHGCHFVVCSLCVLFVVIEIVSFTARDHAAQAVLYKPGPVVVSRVFINARAATEGRPYSCSQSRHIVGGRTMSNNCRGGPPWPPVRLIHNPDVGLSAWIDFKMICKLTTKPGDFDRLSRAEAAHVDAR